MERKTGNEKYPVTQRHLSMHEEQLHHRGTTVGLDHHPLKLVVCTITDACNSRCCFPVNTDSVKGSTKNRI